MLLTFIPFIPALGNGLVNWDDDRMFIKNVSFRGLSADNVHWMFTTSHMGHYQPLSWLTLALDYKLWGLDGRGYHLTNMLFHCGAALLVYFLCRRLLVAASPESVERPTPLILASAAAALFFSIHPLRVESVAWATERRDVQSGLFFVATLLAYVRSVMPGRAALRSFRWYGLCLVCLLLSLGSKAWGMALPVIMLILDVYPMRRVYDAEGRWSARAVLAVFVQKIPMGLFVIPTMAAAYWAQSKQEWGIVSLAEHGLIKRIAQALYGIAFYPLRTLIPRDLSPLYEIPVYGTIDMRPFIVATCAAIGITVAVLVLRKRIPALATAWACYLVTIAPVLGVFQSGPQLVADRYSYLSCLGFAVLGGAGLAVVLAAANPGLRQFRMPAAVLTVAVLAVYGVMTWNQTHVWAATPRIWERVMAVSPDSWIANDNYGTYLVEQGESARAIPYLNKAVQINPEHGGHAWHNLGIALERTGRKEEAMEAFRRGLPSSPERGRTLYELAEIQYSLRRYNEAIPNFKEAAEYVSHAAIARAALGDCYLQLKRFDEAKREYESALVMDPKLKRALRGLERLQQAGQSGR